MKKMILLCAAAVMAFGASAQMSLVKDLAKKASSSNPMDLIAVLEQIEPAMTNPESANDVLTWYTAGKAAFALYDEMQKMKILQQEVDESEMGELLIGAYDAYQKALTLDTIVEVDKKTGQPKLNKDGSKKVKTKYSNEIVDALIGHLGDIASLGNVYWGKEDWANAANAYGYFADLGSSAFAAANGVEQPDSTIAEVRCFQGFAQFNAKDFAAAYESFNKARALGYTANNISVYHVAAMGSLLEPLVKDSKYDEANALIDKAIKDNPTTPAFYDLKGYVAENQTGYEAAYPYYKKAIEMGPDDPDANYYFGRCLYFMTQKIIDENPEATNAQFKPLLEPKYREALPYLRKASELNPSNTDSNRIIDDIMYKCEQLGITDI
jgi:tetratricopeptide (TPR) repeat protein